MVEIDQLCCTIRHPHWVPSSPAERTSRQRRRFWRSTGLESYCSSAGSESFPRARNLLTKTRTRRDILLAEDVGVALDRRADTEPRASAYPRGFQIELRKAIGNVPRHRPRNIWWSRPCPEQGTGCTRHRRGSRRPEMRLLSLVTMGPELASITAMCGIVRTVKETVRERTALLAGR